VENVTYLKGRGSRFLTVCDRGGVGPKICQN